MWILCNYGYICITVYVLYIITDTFTHVSLLNTKLNVGIIADGHIGFEKFTLLKLSVDYSNH